MMTAQATHEHAGSFEHAALFYRGTDEFVRDVGAFVAAGVAASEPVMVAVDQHRIELLRRALGASAERVEFVDMARLGTNPARIISAWERFVKTRGHNGRRVRGVGEPVWPGRRASELAECEVHEYLLNTAFDGGQPWSLLCPYDTSALDDVALDAAKRTHPLLHEGEVRIASAGYGAFDVFDSPLPEPERDSVLRESVFDERDLTGLREIALECATTAGLGMARASDVELVAHELATNSVVHGGGSGRFRAWVHDGSLVLEVCDRGRHAEPLVGRRLPHPSWSGGRGLWMVNHLCDLLQLRNHDGGSIARAHFSL